MGARELRDRCLCRSDDQTAGALGSERAISRCTARISQVQGTDAVGKEVDIFLLAEIAIPTAQTTFPNFMVLGVNMLVCLALNPALREHV